MIPYSALNASLQEAADEHADIILFPEMTLTGFSLRVKEMADYHEETIAYFSALAANIL